MYRIPTYFFGFWLLAFGAWSSAGYTGEPNAVKKDTQEQPYPLGERDKWELERKVYIDQIHQLEKFLAGYQKSIERLLKENQALGNYLEKRDKQLLELEIEKENLTEKVQKTTKERDEFSDKYFQALKRIEELENSRPELRRDRSKGNTFQIQSIEGSWFLP